MFKPLILKKLFFRIGHIFGLTPFSRLVEYELLEYPYYAYGVYHAALQAKALGVSEISAIEFGVAGGKGLVALERHSRIVSKVTGVQISVYGFDAGEGLPEPDDYRDLPYIWKKGAFKMDFAKLKSVLEDAILVIGDVRTTVPEFLQKSKLPTIGFVSFDLDFYSATKSALQVFETQQLLPRTFAYFDDTVGGNGVLHSEYTGELLAIAEFNNDHARKKIAKINGLQFKRLYPAAWNDQMYVCHMFDHPEYCTYIGKADKQLPL